MAWIGEERTVDLGTLERVKDWAMVQKTNPHGLAAWRRACSDLARTLTYVIFVSEEEDLNIVMQEERDGPERSAS